MSNPYGTNPYQSGAPVMEPGPSSGNSGLAIASMVCGIIGIPLTCCCGLFGTPLPLAALIMGGIVIANPKAQGKGMAIAGVVMGAICLLLIVLGFVFMLINPDFAKQMQQFQQMQQMQPPQP